MFTRQWIALAAVLASLLTALMFAAPFMAPYGTFLGMDGTPTVLDNGFLGGPAGVIYAIGDIVCHQEEARCLILNGSQMPICIRDLGILSGLAMGFATSWFLHLRLGDIRYGIIGALMVTITGIEWVAEHFLGDMPKPRLISGIVTGIGAALLFSWMAYRNPVVRGEEMQ